MRKRKKNGRDSVCRYTIAGVYMCLLHVRHRAPPSGASPARVRRDRTQALRRRPPWSRLEQRIGVNDQIPGHHLFYGAFTNGNAGGREGGPAHRQQGSEGSFARQMVWTTPPRRARQQIGPQNADSLPRGLYELGMKKQKGSEGARRRIVDERMERHESGKADDDEYITRTRRACERATIEGRGLQLRDRLCTCRAHLQISTTASLAHAFSLGDGSSNGLVAGASLRLPPCLVPHPRRFCPCKG
ncbi:hypothetical protein C8R45DRAFT_1045429 [Mycena sanguinolenta]|nr:hypothetical protein C8R45DRAFT_1045429 [Mycena sanguinolenta]